MKRILCPLELDRPERNVLPYARALASGLDAHLRALHVGSIPDDVHNPHMVDLLLRSLRAKLDGLVLEDGELPEPRIEREIRFGIPIREIVSEAEETDCDLIVMGTHGREGVVRLLLGSVAEGVVRRASRPVITVPYIDAAPPPPTETIVVATDFSDCSMRTLRVALELGQRLGASVHVVHASAGDASGQPDAAEELAALDAAVTAEGHTMTSEIVQGAPVAELLAAQQRQGAQLLAVGVSGRSALERALLGSVASGLLRQSPVPVLSAR